MIEPMPKKDDNELKDRRATGGYLRLRDEGGGEGGEGGEGGDVVGLVGVAVPWDNPTRIDNMWEGRFDEVFERGAFKRTLGMRTPKLMFEHGRHPMIGSAPLGTFRSLEETDVGLEFDADLFGNWLVEPVRDGVATEAIDGVSIRFRAIHEEIIEAEARDDVEDAEVPLHIIREAELPELGPVMFPAYEGTSVDLRSIPEGLDLSNDSERLRLVLALLGGDAFADRVGNPLGLSTAPKAGAPASTGPASSHPDSPTVQRLRRRVRLHQLREGL